MKRRVLFLLLLSGLSACHKTLSPVSYSYKENKISAGHGADTILLTLIKPYKDSLDLVMNEIIAEAGTELTKKQPECTLGNMMCDLLMAQGNKLMPLPADLCVVNYGGIRIPSLPAGQITRGKVMELMPFENRLVVMELSGRTLDSLFQHMAAKGGWPLHGASYTITGQKATEIRIREKPLSPDQKYRLLISDYLAQGGDNCSMLMHHPYTDLKITIRDALIRGMQELRQNGKTVDAVTEGRVKKAGP